MDPDSDSSAESGAEEDRKYKSLDRAMMDHYQPHYEDLRAGIRKEYWDAYDEDYGDKEDESGLETLHTTAIALDCNKYRSGLEAGSVVPTVTHPGFVPELSTCFTPLIISPNIVTLPNLVPTTPSPAGLASMRAKSPLLTVTSVPLARQSVDGEYVLPNEAFSKELLSPTQEDEELPDYIDIA